MRRLADTTPDAERFQITLFRSASIAKRVALLRSLSQMTIQLSRRAIREANLGADELEARLAIVSLHYDRELANKIRKSLQGYLRTQGLGEGIMGKLDILMALIPVVEAFEKLGVAYHIGGSIASSAYGIPRATADIDLVADLRIEHIKPFVERLESAYYIDEKSFRDAIQRQASFNMIHLDTMLKVDVFIPKARPYDREVFKRILSSTLEDSEDARTFYLKSPEDIILAKLEWYRNGGEVSEHQWTDLLGVLKVQSTSLDFAYLRRWAIELGLTNLLERALREAGL